MRSLEKSQEKMQKICDQIRKDTIEPAKQEAEEMLAAARKRAEELIRTGEHQAQKLLEQAKKQIAQEQAVFRSSLEQAAKQEVEEKFFQEEISSLLNSRLADPRVLADLINGLVGAIEKEGLSADFSVVIPKLVAADDISQLLLESVAKRLKEAPLQLGSFSGGVQVRLRDKKMILDVTDTVLKGILADYVRADFRHLIFGR